MAGKDKGQVGTVMKVIRDERQPRVIVEGLNLVRAAAGRRATAGRGRRWPAAGRFACPLPALVVPATRRSSGVTCTKLCCWAAMSLG